MNTKRLLSILVLSCGLSALGAINIGDTVTNYCWKDLESRTICLDDYKGNVRVLLFNAGWCPPCNSHMTELSKRVQEFTDRPVKFISLSLDGWSKGSPADEKFLKQWKVKHGIPFDVAAALRTDYKDLMVVNGIPADGIVDEEGKLRFRGAGVGVDQLFGEVKKLLVE